MSEDNTTKPTATPTAEEPLLNSVKSDPVAQTLELLKGSQRFSQNVLDEAVISACQRGHKFLVQSLVRLGANVNTQDTKGNTPLMICAENGFTDIAKFLINKQADINVANSAGDTALILSVRPAGSMEMMKLLLEQKGVSINHQNREGYTALMKAIETLDIDLIKLLVEADSKINNRNSKSESDELDLVMNNKGETTQKIAEKCGLNNVLIVLKKYLNSSMYSRTSPLILAADMNDVLLFSLLMNSKILSDREHFIDAAMTHLFQRCHIEDVKTFTDIDVLMIKKCLKNGADPTRNVYGTQDYLSIVAESGNCTLVKVLCEHGAVLKQFAGKTMNIDYLVSNYKTLRYYPKSPLDCALIHGHIDCANILLEYGAQIDVKVAMDSAVKHEQPKYLTFLTENYKQEVINCLSSTRSNSLFVSAVRKGNLDIIGQLLDLNIDVNEPDDDGVTPLGESNNKEVATLLIQRGADVNCLMKSRYGKVSTILHILSRSMSVTSKQDIVQVLLDNGADVNGRDGLGRTPLMLAAAEDGNESLLQMLLDHGAELTATDIEGNTVLIHAARRNSSTTLYLLQLIGDKNSFLNVQNKQGETALIVAVENKNVSVTQKLLDMGADVNIKDKDGNIALLYVIVKNIGHFIVIEALNQYGNENQIIIKMLIKAGSDVNCQNNNGLSPLMVAAKDCLKEIMKVLLESGADVNAVSWKDSTRTALSLIFSSAYSNSGSKCCVNILLDHGASSSCVSLDVLFKLIEHNHVDIIQKLIRNGLGPENKMSDDVYIGRNDVGFEIPMVTPFSATLHFGRISLARYFVDNLYLTTLDLSLMANEDLRRRVKSRNNQECINFLNEITSQPMSLFSLAFVSASSCLGTGPGRENRVDMLPLPRKIKDKLLFKTEEVNVKIPTTASNTRSESEPLWSNVSINRVTHTTVYRSSITYSSTSYDYYDYDFDDRFHYRSDTDSD